MDYRWKHIFHMNPLISLKLLLPQCALSHAISHCARVGASDNDGQIQIDCLSKERKEEDDEQERKKSEGLTFIHPCHTDKSGDGDSQWTRITFTQKCYNSI